MTNRHTGTGRFIAGQDLGTYRGQARHDPSTEEIKTTLHTSQPRTPVVAHAGAQSVGTDGVKPTAHDRSGPNADTNAAYNKAAQHSTRAAGSATPGQIVGSGIKLS